MPCPDRLSQWKQEVSTAFVQFAQTANVGSGSLERGNRALGSSRDHATRVALLALVLDQQEQAVFQRLREW